MAICTQSSLLSMFSITMEKISWSSSPNAKQLVSHCKSESEVDRSGRSFKDVTELRRAINFTITYQRSTHVRTWREDALCIDSRISCQRCEVRSDGVALQIPKLWTSANTMFEQASNNLKRVTSQVGWRL